MLVINQAEVGRALPMPACIQLMRETLAALARGEAVQPLRTHIATPDKRGILGMMPGYLAPANALGIKVLTIFPANEGTAVDSHQGAVLLFEEERGILIAVLDATAITGIRTAAVSGLATDLLASPGASDLAILGAGTQALTHAEAMFAVRTIGRVRLWNRTPERARSLAALIEQRFGLGVEVCPGVEQAVAGADLICTTTAAREPILRSEWVRPGAHLNVVGSSIPRSREVDSALMARARLFVDLRESALKEPGDILIPLAEGAIGPDHIVAELGELAAGKRVWQRSPDDVTLFKSQGIAIEDIASARFVYEEARRQGIGTEVALGGEAMVHATRAGVPNTPGPR
jgi:ornithine cyclodeaminase/alanine dehydrogenase-like protein (mu-crystallin family)